MFEEMKKSVKDLESVILYDNPEYNNDNVPQVADSDELLTTMLERQTAKPHEEISVEIHNQIDPSYQ